MILIKKMITQVVIMIFLVCPISLIAQPDANGNDPQGSDVPVDGGLSLLLASGAVYGFKRLRGHQRDNR
jgi:hypothetical protein